MDRGLPGLAYNFLNQTCRAFGTCAALLLVLVIRYGRTRMLFFGHVTLMQGLGDLAETTWKGAKA